MSKCRVELKYLFPVDNDITSRKTDTARWIT